MINNRIELTKRDIDNLIKILKTGSDTEYNYHIMEFISEKMKCGCYDNIKKGGKNKIFLRRNDKSKKERE
jgi:hypothetical protein